MFNILKLPSEDSHLEEFEALQAEAIADGNERDASHWQTMANAEKIIATSAEQETNKGSK